MSCEPGVLFDACGAKTEAKNAARSWSPSKPTQSDLLSFDVVAVAVSVLALLRFRMIHVSASSDSARRSPADSILTFSGKTTRLEGALELQDRTSCAVKLASLWLS